MSSDGTYAPKSPDLSSFYSTAPADHQQQQQPGVQHSQPRSGSGGPQRPYPGQPQSQGQQHLQAPTSYFSPPQQQHSLPQSAPLPASQYLPPDALSAGYSPHPHQYSPPGLVPQSVHPATPNYPLQAPQSYPNYYQPYADPQHQHQQPPAAHPQQYSQPPFYNPAVAPHQEPSLLDAQARSLQQPDTMPPRRSAAQAAQQQAQIAPSPVKTKFPTARIKRIMQADEEVGKVAQQTPIAVGKALELFMVALVSKSADVAREKNSKRVTAQMLKHVVESDDQWDFLRDIVGKVENEEKAGKAGKTKAESESEEEMPEKKKAKVGRKKKAA